MSVAEPVIDHLDTAAKRIYLAAGVRSYHPVADIYAEVRNLRRTDESLRGFPTPVSAAGNVSKGGGKFTPRFAVLEDGWRIVPEDTSHTLRVLGEQLTSDGGSGADALDLTGLSASSRIAVEYEPPSSEIIQVQVGVMTQQDRQEITESIMADSRILTVARFVALK